MSYEQRKLTTKKEQRYINSLGVCPKCNNQMVMVESRYIEGGSNYTFSCKEHGYFSLKYSVAPKKKPVEK